MKSANAILFALAGLLVAVATVVPVQAQCPAPGVSHPSAVLGADYESRTFTWDEVDDAMYYQLWINKDGGVFHREWFLGDTSWTSDDILQAGTYTVYVRTWSPCGFGPWSTGLVEEVACDYNSAPWSGSPSGDTFNLQYRGTFEWTRGMPKATWYNIYIEQNGGVYANRWLPYRYGYGYANGRYSLDVDELGGPLPCGEYAWKLRTWSACNGTTGWSSDYNFTVNCCTGVPVQIATPQGFDSWHGYASAIIDPRPFFFWDDAGDAVWHNVYIERNQRAYFNGWTRDTWWEPDGDLASGEYAIFVRGWNQCGAGEWSTGSVFQVQCIEPSAPSGLHTLFGYGYGYGMMDAAVGWYQEEGVYWYQLLVQRDGATVYNRWLDYSNPDHPLYPGWVISAYPDALGRHGDYSWYVRAWNPCGTSPWSGPDTYSIDCELTRPMLSAPIGTVNERRPFLGWMGQPDVGDYRIVLQRNGRSFLDQSIEDWSTGAYDVAEEASTFSEAGSGQGWKADDAYWTLNLPFGFPFFDTTQSVVYVNANGTLHFGTPSSEETADEHEFRESSMIAVLWNDIRTDGAYNPVEDIYVASSPTAVSIRWKAETYAESSAVNCMATLYPDGTIRLQYGPGNWSGGWYGISAGDGIHFIGDETSGGANNADDIVYSPSGMDGLVGVRPDWNFPDGSYRWWLQPRSECYGNGPWSAAGDFTIDAP